MGRKVFIGNIPYSLRQEEFQTYFQEFENFERGYLVFNRDKPGENKGFGFAIFTDPSSAKAVAEKEHTMGGQVLDCRLHDVKEEQYFVQHLPSDMTEQRLREYFESLGAVHKIALKQGFAFVTVKLSDDGLDMFTKDHSALGEGVVVKKARQQNRDGGFRGRGRGFRGRGGFGFRGRGNFRGRGRGFHNNHWGPPPFGGFGDRGGYRGGYQGNWGPPRGGRGRGFRGRSRGRGFGGPRGRGGRGYQRGGYQRGGYGGGYQRGGYQPY